MAGSATLVDPRGLRFAATITAIVLAAVLLTSNGIVLAVQAAVFAIGAFGGLRWAPYGLLFATRSRSGSVHLLNANPRRRPDSLRRSVSASRSSV